MSTAMVSSPQDPLSSLQDMLSMYEALPKSKKTTFENMILKPFIETHPVLQKFAESMSTLYPSSHDKVKLHDEFIEAEKPDSASTYPSTPPSTPTKSGTSDASSEEELLSSKTVTATHKSYKSVLQSDSPQNKNAPVLEDEEVQPDENEPGIEQAVFSTAEPMSRNARRAALNLDENPLQTVFDVIDNADYEELCSYISSLQHPFEFCITLSYLKEILETNLYVTGAIKPYLPYAKNRMSLSDLYFQFLSSISSDHYETMNSRVGTVESTRPAHRGLIYEHFCTLTNNGHQHARFKKFLLTGTYFRAKDGMCLPYSLPVPFTMNIQQLQTFYGDAISNNTVDFQHTIAHMNMSGGYTEDDGISILNSFGSDRKVISDRVDTIADWCKDISKVSLQHLSHFFNEDMATSAFYFTVMKEFTSICGNFF